jgi:hypothetical protein
MTTEEPPSKDQSQAPKELTDKVAALKQLINIHDLLSVSTFEGHRCERVSEGMKFITILHKQLLDEATKHPQAHLVPNLLKKEPIEDTLG